MPDSAQQLALLAPALAGEGIWSAPHPAAGAGKRRVLILATADGLAPGRLSAASRTLQGALLAPGFAADAETRPARQALLQALERALGQPPSLLQAYAADAAAAIRASLGSGAHDRAGLLAALRKGGGPPVLLYRLEGNRLRSVP